MTAQAIAFISHKARQEGFFLLCCRLFLGGLFIYASVDKIAHPSPFATAIYNYQILPHALINLTAIVLPWLELVLGVFLVAGVLRQGSASMALLLLLVFLGAMLFNLARGLDIHCGCFHTSIDPSEAAPMAWYVVRDVLFLAPALYLFYGVCLRKGRVALA